MKKILAISVFLFVCVSTVFGIHPLIGKWKFSFVIGGTRFYDYVTITTVNTTTKKVSGYLTGLSSYKLTGYYNGNIVYIEDSFADYYIDGYYFTFQGTPSLKKHLGICAVSHEFDAYWHALSTTKLSSSIASTEIMTLSDVLNQKALKKTSSVKGEHGPREKNSE